MEFMAEIKKVEAVKLVSNDIEIRLLLNTNQSELLDLGKYPADTLFRVQIDPANREARVFTETQDFSQPESEAEKPLPQAQEPVGETIS